MIKLEVFIKYLTLGMLAMISSSKDLFMSEQQIDERLNKLEADLVSQEHRFIPMIRNLTCRKEPHLRSPAIFAFFCFLLSPSVIAAGSLLLGVTSLFLVYRQNDLLAAQNVMFKEQNKIASEQLIERTEAYVKIHNYGVGERIFLDATVHNAGTQALAITNGTCIFSGGTGRLNQALILSLKEESLGFVVRQKTIHSLRFDEKAEFSSEDSRAAFSQTEKERLKSESNLFRLTQSG